MRLARTKAEMSQEDIAAATGIPLTNLGRIERGARNTTVRELGYIAAAADSTPAEIATDALKAFGGSVEGGLDRLMSEAKGKPAGAGDANLSEEELRKKYELAAQEQTDETDPAQDTDPAAHTA